MQVLRKLCRLALAVVAIPALAAVAEVAEADVAVEATNYRGWHDSIRLFNGTVEVIVVPAVGRIMRYGYVGGPNLIWEDPALSGKPADSVNFPRFGGNKAWPWPQDEWPKYIGHDWPPPPAADQAPFTLARSVSGTVTLRSPLVAGFGVYIEREIQLAPTGTHVTLKTRLTLASGAKAPVLPLAAWSITPAAAPDALLISLTPGSELPSHYRPLGAFDPFASLTVKDGILRVVRNPEKSSKIGIDGDAIGALYGNTLWILTADRVGMLPAGERYGPGERVQIYANADSREDLAHGLPPYMELEMTSPRKALKTAEDSVTLTETWELRKLAHGDDPQRALKQALGPL